MNGYRNTTSATRHVSGAASTPSDARFDHESKADDLASVAAEVDLDPCPRIRVGDDHDSLPRDAVETDLDLGARRTAREPGIEAQRRGGRGGQIKRLRAFERVRARPR